MIENTEGQILFINCRENERRRIGYSSLRSKIASTKIMLDTADQLITESAVEFGGPDKQLSNEEYAKRYCQNEAVFACVEEAIQNLLLIKTLCARLSGPVKIPPLERFNQAVENDGISKT